MNSSAWVFFPVVEVKGKDISMNTVPKWITDDVAEAEWTPREVGNLAKSIAKGYAIEKWYILNGYAYLKGMHEAKTYAKDAGARVTIHQYALAYRDWREQKLVAKQVKQPTSGTPSPLPPTFSGNLFDKIHEIAQRFHVKCVIYTGVLIFWYIANKVASSG